MTDIDQGWVLAIMSTVAGAPLQLPLLLALGSDLLVGDARRPECLPSQAQGGLSPQAYRWDSAHDTRAGMCCSRPLTAQAHRSSVHALPLLDLVNTRHPISCLHMKYIYIYSMYI